MSIPPTPPVTLLAAIDYSEASALVLEQALAAARRMDAQELHFLHVRTEDGGDEEREAQRAEFGQWLGIHLQAARGVPHTVEIVAHIASGNPATVIVGMASDLLASLVVVGTHGRKGVQRMVMGSVAEAVVRNSGCTVLVVRPTAHHQTGPQIEPPCPVCVRTRLASHGQQLWCDQHLEKHGRRHTYYNTRLSTWVNRRITL